MPLTPAMIVRRETLVEKTARPARSVVRERSSSGEDITPEISLTVSAVLAAFTILTEDLSSLPLLLYERRGRNKFRAYDSLYYRLMHDQPNPEHTSMVFREFVTGHLLAWGNFYGQLITDKKGDVQEIWPLRPDRMTVERLEGQRIYRYQTADGKPRVFLAEELLHVPAFGFDGLIGYSRIALARNAIGLSISAEKFGSKFYANGTNVGVIFTHPTQLSDPARDHLEDSMKARAGVENSNTAIILEEGMGIEKLGIPPNDAQFLETRKFQVSEIARIFRVPPHMIGDVERSTSWGSGIDSQEQGYVNHTLRPWAKRIEEHLNARLLLEQDRQTYYYEHLMDGLLRGDIATRYQAYVSAITNGFMSRNEARERENMNPRKGLDEILQPLNMTTVSDGQANNGDPAQAANALLPMWRDTLARVLKREENDVLGAARRFLGKGQAETFESWAEQFYGSEHPAFAARQFGPLLSAVESLSDTQDVGTHLGALLLSLLDARLSAVRGMTVEQIAESFGDYAAQVQERVMAFAQNIARQETEVEHDDYE